MHVSSLPCPSPPSSGALGGNPAVGSSQGCGAGLWLLRMGASGLGPAGEGKVSLWLLTQVVPSRPLLASPFVLGERPALGRQRALQSAWSSDWGSDSEQLGFGSSLNWLFHK